MHAVVVKVDIEPGRHRESVDALNEHIMPMCKGAPGFVRGTWYGDDKTGVSLMLFESEQSARQTAAQVRSNPEEPAQVTEVQVYEVVGEC